jgi:hypothetical protein
MVSSDSIEAAKPMLLKVARYTAPKVRWQRSGDQLV